MFGSQVLDVGIGLAMLFAFMSLIATALNEALEAFLKVRAQQLEQGVRNMLDDSGKNEMTQKFYNNPLISVLYSKDSYKASDLAPSNVSLVGRPGPLATDVRARSIPRSIRANLPSYIPSASFALAVLSIAAGDNSQAKAADIRKSLVTTLKDSNQLRGVVLQALASGQGDLKAAQKFLEDWYDAAMGRVSGWYKRRAQKILFFIGLFAAVVLNVDTITVARSLIADPALRQAVVNHAADHDGSAALDFDASKKALMSVGYPIGWTDLPQLQPMLDTDPRLKADAEEEFKRESEQIGPNNPLRYKCAPAACVSELFKIGPFETVPAMALGWLVTALAITLGAPFWFDLLGTFMQIRSTLKPAPPAAAANGQQGPTAPPADKGGVSGGVAPGAAATSPQAGATAEPDAAARTAPGGVMFVRDIQAMLNKVLTPSPRLGIDGDYGPKTKAAVTDFQRANNLDVDGWAGPQTIAALERALTIP